MAVVHYVLEAGSVNRGHLRWTSNKRPGATSADIDALAMSIAADLTAGHTVTLGVECVLFIPCPNDPARLAAAREGECTPETGNKPFTAAAGACATMTGLQAVAWLLRKVHSMCPSAKATVQWDEFLRGEASLFVWEAFVSGTEKGKDHHEDALLALEALQASMDHMNDASRVRAENPVNLVGAIILWAGMSTDSSLLSASCIVLRPLPKRPEGAA